MSLAKDSGVSTRALVGNCTAYIVLMYKNGLTCYQKSASEYNYVFVRVPKVMRTCFVIVDFYIKYAKSNSVLLAEVQIS